MPFICLHQEGISNLPHFIEKAEQCSYTMVAVPLNFFELPTALDEESFARDLLNFAYPDVLLDANEWSNKVIFILSDHIDCDSVDAKVRRDSELVLHRNSSWAHYLQYCGYTMIRLKSTKNMNLARIAAYFLKGILLVQVPMHNAEVAQSKWRRDISQKELERMEQEYDSWHWWNFFRSAVNFNVNVKVVLELNNGKCPSMEIVRRWLGEPVQAIIIPSSLFLLNRLEHPVLPKKWKEVLKHFLGLDVSIIINTAASDNNIKLYSEYLLKLMQEYSEAPQWKIYADVLQIPLQPLHENLDCCTYEVFERDPVKYKMYQEAIAAALTDRVDELEIGHKLIVVMVLGAGRGPLVRCILNAAEKTKRKVRIYIIEKNENAIRTLNCVARKLWHDKDVRIFSKDMRKFTPPEKADILVSELLGSFGDNELSPECLDCAQKLLKSDGISIPCKSMSYINPLMSSKLFNAVRHLTRYEINSQENVFTYETNCECGYQVLLKNIYNIGFPQALFEFIYSNIGASTDNSRYKVLYFDVDMDCVFNGIAGYFDTVLYKNIKLSINPNTHTPGMISWFPLYFPIAEPMNVKKGQKIEIHFWRCISEQKVWYEWCVNAPFTTRVHNKWGRSWPIHCA